VDTESCTQGDSSEDWSRAAIGQGTPEIATKAPEARREAKESLFLTLVEAARPCQPLDLRPVALRTVKQIPIVQEKKKKKNKKQRNMALLEDCRDECHHQGLEGCRAGDSHHILMQPTYLACVENRWILEN